MQKLFHYAGAKRLGIMFGPLLVGLSGVFADPVLAADPLKRLNLALADISFESPDELPCLGTGRPCDAVPSSAVAIYPETKSEPAAFRYGLNVGDFGPVRVKFTGKRIKVRLLF